MSSSFPRSLFLLLFLPSLITCRNYHGRDFFNTNNESDFFNTNNESDLFNTNNESDFFNTNHKSNFFNANHKSDFQNANYESDFFNANNETNFFNANYESDFNSSLKVADSRRVDSEGTRSTSEGRLKMNVLVSSLTEVVMSNKWQISLLALASIILLSLILGLIFALNSRRNVGSSLRTGHGQPSSSRTGHGEPSSLRTGHGEPSSDRRISSRITNESDEWNDQESGIVNPSLDMRSERIEMRPVPLPRSSLQPRLREETPPPSYSKVAVTLPFKNRPCFEAARRTIQEPGPSGFVQPSAPSE